MAQWPIGSWIKKAKGGSHPSWWKRVLLSSILILAGCSVGYYLGEFAAAGIIHKSGQPKIDSVNGLYIDPNSLNIGEVWETPCHLVTLQVRNISNQDRNIVSFTGSCGCLAVEPPALIIPAAKTAELSLKIDLTNRLPYQVGLGRRPMSVRLSPVFEGDFGASAGWELRAEIQSRLTLETLRIEFTDQCTHSGRVIARKIRARAHIPLKSVQAFSDPAIANVQVESVPGSQDSNLIIVSPQPNLQAGPFSFEVQIRAVTPNEEVYQCASIQAFGEMQPSCKVFPRMILLGERALSDLAEADIFIGVPSPEWKIEQIATDTTSTAVTQTAIEPDGSIKLLLSQRISGTGDQVSHVQIRVQNSKDRQTEILKVDVRYHGQHHAD